jgi:hypothetical protein
MRRRLLLAAALVFASLALAPVGLTATDGGGEAPSAAVGGGEAPSGAGAGHVQPPVAEAQACGASVANVTFAETRGVDSVNATGAVLAGEGRVEDVQPTTGWFEYRAVGATEWRTTARRTDDPDACGRVWFQAALDGLARNTTYEYRVVVDTGDDTARGNVSRFRTGTTQATASETAESVPATNTSTDTPTPDPCPTFRGVGSLCTGTPTPHEGDGVPPATTADVDEVGPGPDRGLLAWFGGVLPLVAWVAVVAVLAPLVLGGLVGLDSLRGRR